MDLHEWLELYVRHRDAYSRKLQQVVRDGERIICTYPDHTLEAIALPTLALPTGSGKRIIATLHTKQNVQFLIDNWPRFSTAEGLTIIFVNPQRNEKWLIKPALHARVTEGDIAPGIWSIADGIVYA